MLLSLLGNSLSFAGSLTVLPMPPVEADGVTAVQVQVYAPGVVPGDRLRVKPTAGVVGSAAIPAPDMILFEYTPVTAFAPGEARVRIQVRGKTDEELRIPVLPPAVGELNVSFEPQTWSAGTKGTVELTVTAQGPHPLPLSARVVMLNASSGKLGAVHQNEDGSWGATWTPATSYAAPQHVVFTATDATAPDTVVGYGAIPILVERDQPVSAAAGTQNVLVIGDAQYGPVPAGPEGFVIKAKLDPRIQTATLQSVDEFGSRQDQTIELEMSSPAVLAFAPLPMALPTGYAMTVHALLLQGNGQPWSGSAPTLNSKSGKSLGQGWYRFELETSTEPGKLSLDLQAGELKQTRSVTLVDAVPTLALSSDPASLKDKQRDFAVTAHLKRADGSAMTKRKLGWQIQGASKVGGVRDNGDGTYTQKMRLSTKVDQAQVSAWPLLKNTGLPTRSLVMWTDKAALLADGSGTVSLTVVALDATGMPVPNTELKLTVPMGDVATQPQVTTDRYGVAKIEVKAGTQAGFVAIQADAEGVTGRTLLTLYAEGQEQAGVETGGSAADRARVARWQQTLVSITVGRVGSDLGPPAALAMSSVPAYTTPGAAILVTVKVLDAAGKPIVDQSPTLSASVGKVGAVMNNGDGTYNVPVQLPAGVDGPLTVQATVGGATGSTELPTLAGMSAAAFDPVDGGSERTGRSPREGGGERDSGGFNATARIMLAGLHYSHSATRDNTDGNGRVPSEVGFEKKLIPGAVVQIDGHGATGVGFDVGGRVGSYKLQVETIELSDQIYPLHAALTFGVTKGPAYLYGGLGGSMVDMPILRYNEDLTDVGVFDRRVIGARLSAGAAVTQEMFSMRFDLAETFAPAPVMTSLGLFVDVPVSYPAHVSLGYQLHMHHAKLAVPPSGDEADIAKVRAKQGAITLGLGWAF